ncbi:hypothetical protein FQN50_007531 [Emmonsiellopsis sp. PD_5]|nr:hypothetical protein FQN50_007531 [Emmonsiellopsis sp. PD_5]
MGKTFRKINASLAGDFGAMTDKIKQWVEANGGTFSKNINSNVTHLIATKAAFRQPLQAVRDARKVKGLKIVKIEWLEDSLLSKSRKPKREAEYLWARPRNGGKGGSSKGGNRDAPRTAGVKKPRRINGELDELDGYHIFTDTEGLGYFVTLVRPMPDSKFKEKYKLGLYESDATPHTYSTFVKYSRVGIGASSYLALAGSSWDVAFGGFKKFFKAKCGTQWEERMHVEPEPKKDEEGCPLPADENWFRCEVLPAVPSVSKTAVEVVIANPPPLVAETGIEAGTVRAESQVGPQYDGAAEVEARPMWSG